MPQNPFLMFQQYETKPPRNTVDLSHRNNGTYTFGNIYPVCCLEVNPGESFKIDSAFGLKFFPMPFPIQTPMNASMHFYYVRNRTIWKDWMDFIYNNKQVVHPYISRPSSDKDFWSTGGIADRLDVPTVIVGNDGTTIAVRPVYGMNYNVSPVGLSPIGNSAGTLVTSADMPALRSFYFYPFVDGGLPVSANLRMLGASLRKLCAPQPNELWVRCDAMVFGGFYGLPQSDSGLVFDFSGSVVVDPDRLESIIEDGFVSFYLFCSDKDNEDPLEAVYSCVRWATTDITLSPVAEGSSTIRITLKSDNLADSAFDLSQKRWWIVLAEDTSHVSSRNVPGFVIPVAGSKPNTNFIGSFVSTPVLSSEYNEISLTPGLNPFASDATPNGPALPLSALPFRAYEAVYNAYFRNERLEPLMIDGQPEYNVYSPSMGSGADDFPYKIYKRNWEADFLTSSLPTPQQGIAPVVGVTGLSNIQIQDPDTNDIYNFTAETADDGETIVGGSFHNPDASLAARRTAQDIVTAGFTINDFRNVSALQRWVENNIRRGLKYRDQVMANTGVKVRYDELDMPEFIGGYSRRVEVSSITQTAPGGDAGVGDYAGQASCFGGSRHTISHYCDEAGFIIGVMTVTPVPVYSQLLPKYFLKRSPLDYHHPVFNHIGMQPVTYDQVCPLQVYSSNPGQSDGGVKFSDVFGYQRPYYDLLQHVDTVHGQMRTTMRQYLMNRVFSGVPELGGDFVHVDPDQLNDVFTITKEGDVIMGEILFRIYAKRPVSLFGQPKIV